MSQRIQQRGSKFPPLMSSFLWLLRDMDLTINCTSPTEWLLQKLKAPRCKQIVDALTSSFSSIECIFLPRPSMTDEVLQDIIQRRDQLSPQFNDQVEQAKNTLLSKIKPKQCKDGPFTGFSFGSLIKQCVADINGHSQLSNLEATWKAAVNVELLQYAQKLVIKYEKDMSLTLGQLLPIEEGSTDSTDTTTLMGIHNRFLAKNISVLEDKLASLVPIKEVRNGFWKTIQCDFISRIIEKDAGEKITGGILATFLHENRKLSSELCLKTYARFYDQIVASRLRNSLAEGIPYDITTDLQQFEEQYNKIACGPAKEEVYSTKRKESLVEEKQLLQIPGYVEDLQIIGISSDRMKLTWCKPSVNSTAAHAYEVYMNDDKGNFVLLETTNNCYALIKNLKSNKHYTFVVKARNDHFCGNHTSYVSAKTSLSDISRTAIGVGTFLAFALGSPIVFSSIVTAGTVVTIRNNIREQKFATAIAEGASLALLPLAIPFGSVVTSLILAPIAAGDAFSAGKSKGDVSEDDPTKL